METADIQREESQSLSFPWLSTSFSVQAGDENLKQLWAGASSTDRRGEQILHGAAAAVGVETRELNASPTAAQLGEAELVMLFGDEALHAIAGIDGSIADWRGSAMRVGDLRNKVSTSREDYLPLLHAAPHSALQDRAWLVPTLHPSKVAKQYKWHPWLMMDLQRSKRIADGKGQQRTKRKWFFNDLAALERLESRLRQPTTHAGVLGFDTESWPYYIVGLVVEDEVHVYGWDEKFRAATEAIFASPFVIKVAHNIQHDLTFLKKKLGVDVALPWYDTLGGAHVLNNALDKNLSPAIATRYTDWPFHKWLVDIDPLWYNGMDNVVAYDAYAPQLQELLDRNLYEVAKHDMHLLQPLLDMQWHGFKVDKDEQRRAVTELAADRERIALNVSDAVRPIVDSKLSRFAKPNLFERTVRCDHCGGGKIAAQHCWRCGGLSKKPIKKADYGAVTKQSVKELRSKLPVCSVCSGSGKITKRLEFNPDSSDQVADVLYRGLGIRPRRYKGVETVRVGLIEPLAGDYPLVAKLVEYARVNADYETVKRLTAGPDGRLHCVFNPFGTDSGRVSSSEGLVEVGTNAMNIPKKARRLVIPDEEQVFLYPDMKALEGRVIAVVSKDQRLKDVFNDAGADLHILVRDDIRKKLGFSDFTRAQTKRLNYAAPYGANAKQLAVELTDTAFKDGVGTKLNEAQGQLLLDTLFGGWYRGVAQYQQSVVEQILSTRKVVSVTGRERRWLDYIYDPRTKSLKREIAKQGWSFVPQDAGAWVLAVGLMRSWQSGTWDKFRGLIHVHDAMLYQAPKKDEEEAKAVLTKLLTSELWGMKFLTEMKVGENWYAAS